MYQLINQAPAAVLHHQNRQSMTKFPFASRACRQATGQLMEGLVEGEIRRRRSRYWNPRNLGEWNEITITFWKSEELDSRHVHPSFL
jgi:hypothetical protein